MKKIFMIAFVAAATLSFTACNTKTDGAAKSDADTTKVVAPAQENTTTEGTTTEGSALDKYAVVIEKVIALQDKAKSGDAAAIKELTNLNKEVMDLATQLQNEMATMTPEQTAKFTELAKKLTDAASKN